MSKGPAEPLPCDVLMDPALDDSFWGIGLDKGLHKFCRGCHIALYGYIGKV